MADGSVTETKAKTEGGIYRWMIHESWPVCLLVVGCIVAMEFYKFFHARNKMKNRSYIVTFGGIPTPLRDHQIIFTLSKSFYNFCVNNF